MVQTRTVEAQVILPVLVLEKGQPLAAVVLQVKAKPGVGLIRLILYLSTLFFRFQTPIKVFQIHLSNLECPMIMLYHQMPSVVIQRA